MNAGKLMTAALAASALIVPATAAVRPSVKPIDVSVQKAVAPAVHQARRAGVRSKNANQFQPGGIIGAISGAAGGGVAGAAAVTFVAVTTVVVVDQVAGLGITDSIVGGDSDPYGTGSTN